jgi:D-inositol-3-phosphate glycosyltransferase
VRVHHVVPHFHPDTGGVETHVLRLSEFLVERGHEVVVHTSSRSYTGSVLPARGTIGNVEVQRYPPRFRLGYYATLFRPRIDAGDIVHLHGYAHLTNDWTARRVRGRIPTVFSLHHGVAQPAPSFGSRVKREVYDPLIGRKTLAIVDAIVAASEPDRRWLESRGLGGPRVHVIPTGLEEAAYIPGDPERARSRFGLGRYFLYLGRLHREKSVDHLLRAFASLGRIEATLVLAGPDAGAKRDLLDLAARLGVADRVKAIGEVDEATKRHLLAGAEALVLPSFYEAQGIVLLEAWAQAHPVVASEVGGVPFLVSNRTDGLLYPYGDVRALTGHLKDLLDDPSRGAAMGAAGREKARKYAWEKVAPQFFGVYERVRTR